MKAGEPPAFLSFSLAGPISFHSQGKTPSFILSLPQTLLANSVVLPRFLASQFSSLSLLSPLEFDSYRKKGKGKKAKIEKNGDLQNAISRYFSPLPLSLPFPFFPFFFPIFYSSSSGSSHSSSSSSSNRTVEPPKYLYATETGIYAFQIKNIQYPTS
jgi:hypothetical protein